MNPWLTELAQTSCHHKAVELGARYLASSPLLYSHDWRRLSLFEARLLCRHVQTSDQPLTPPQSQKFVGFLQRRWSAEPVDYILGTTEFYGHRFAVSSHVLIPRPETEELMELIIHHYQSHPTPRSIIDVATGSGCLAISLAKYYPEAQVVGLDICRDALLVAGENVTRLSVNSQTTLMTFDMNLHDHWQKLAEQWTADLVICNPPYVDFHSEKSLLSEETLRFEPHLALDGGAGGLSYYHKLARFVPQLLTPEGVLAMEIGHRQGPAVSQLFDSPPWRKAEIHNDLSGKQRFIIAYL